MNDREYGSAAGARQMCTFSLADLHFGVDVLAVQEVIRQQEMTRVPLAPNVVEGLINLRGQIVIAIDLRLRLGLPPREPGEAVMNVVIRTDDGAVSLLVDEIGDVVDVDDSIYEPSPETLKGIGRDLIRGVYKFPDRLLHALDVPRTLALSAVA